MRLKKKPLKDCSLYAILDNATAARKPLTSLGRRFADAGVDMVQLRDKKGSKKEFLKNALRLQNVFAKTHTLFILNDHVDIAQSIECDGVHLGQDDLPLKYARKLLGKEKIIGISCHSLRQARAAEKEGADYIGIGPLWVTPTKPRAHALGLKLIVQCLGNIRIPFFAIGSIDLGNAALVVRHGASRIAVCRALCNAKNIDTTVSEFRKILETNKGKSQKEKSKSTR